MSNKIPNQNNYQDSQNFEVDIDKLYNDFILPIDKIRSFSNTNIIGSQAASTIFSSTDPISKLRNNAKIETKMQESRCHAFYRIIGFPVISSDFKIYNPGLDIIYSEDRTISLQNKFKIASSPLNNFRELSIERELYPLAIQSIFNQNESLDASVLALSSSVHIRSFVSSMLQDDPFDMEIKNQKHKVNFDSLVGIHEKKLNEYVDVMGNTPTKLSNQRAHIIKPFIVDSVIDFAVNDSIKLVAVPFVPSKSELFVRDSLDGFVNRPILEKVIRDRCIIINQTNTIGNSNKEMIDYIKNIPAIRDENIINQISGGDVYKLSEQAQFIKFINIIRGMMKKLVEAQISINETQSKYYWLPIPSVAGPEGGCSTRGVLLSTNVPSDLITVKDQAIIDAKIKNVINQINSQTTNLEGTPDVGGFAFDNFKSTFGSDNADSLGDMGAQNLQNLVTKRNTTFQKSNKALRDIEIIIGEFSGLGLCDIIAVMASLYIIPKKDLLGFLDDDARKRMQNLLKISEEASDIRTSMASLNNSVKNFYNLMDKIYQDLLQNNGL